MYEWWYPLQYRRFLVVWGPIIYCSWYLGLWCSVQKAFLSILITSRLFLTFSTKTLIIYLFSKWETKVCFGFMNLSQPPKECRKIDFRSHLLTIHHWYALEGKQGKEGDILFFEYFKEQGCPPHRSLIWIIFFFPSLYCIHLFPLYPLGVLLATTLHLLLLLFVFCYILTTPTESIPIKRECVFSISNFALLLFLVI